MSLRRKIGEWLRRWADRIDDDGAPKPTQWSFTFEQRPGGVQVRTDGRGCRLWYLGKDDYEKAHTEADTEHLQVDWEKATAHRVGGGL